MSNQSPATSQIEQLVSHLKVLASNSFQRRGLVLCGENSWAREAGRVAAMCFDSERTLWVGADGPDGIRSLPGAKIHQILGQEIDCAVFNAFDGFDPDAFGAVSGSIRGGGLLLLLAPHINDWPQYADPEYARIIVANFEENHISGRFLSRLARTIQSDKSLTVVLQNEDLPETETLSSVQNIERAAGPICRTKDQELAIEAIIKVSTGHRRRPLIITSDRGRGKSSALGFAAAKLLTAGLTRVVVTAPRLSAVSPVFDHALELLPGATDGKGTIEYQQGKIEFIAPDRLLQQAPTADILLVDEAAAIPNGLLEDMLRRYSRIVFSTTVHGYEGTGRGFATRFQSVLKRETPGFKTLQMQEPIRWANDDPLESFCFRSLLLDAEPVSVDQIRGATPESCHWEQVDRDDLAQDNELLAQIFGLLVNAHYQTSPMDLRHLLDGPNLSVFALRFNDAVIGTVLLAAEGELDPDLCDEIWRGHRRPRGHLIAQSLATHLGLIDGPRSPGARIIRIAVHPGAQRKGLGSLMLEQLFAYCQRQGFDYLGSCFGATEDLLAFWQKSGLHPIRIGIKREAASGAHSCIVMRPVSAAGESLFRRAYGRFIQNLPLALADSLRQLEPALAVKLFIVDEPVPPNSLSEQDWQDIHCFAESLRQYECCQTSIWRLVILALQHSEITRELESGQIHLLVGRVLQMKGWQQVCIESGLCGKAQAITLLRKTIALIASRLKSGN